MRKFLIHKENGNGPEEIEIDDSNNPYGVIVTPCISGHLYPEKTYYVLDREELLKYCADSEKEAWTIKKHVLESLMLYHKSKYQQFSRLLDINRFEVQFTKDFHP